MVNVEQCFKIINWQQAIQKPRAIVPSHSVTMDGVPGWSGVITKHDMGAGTHLTITADLAVISGVAAIITQ